MKINESQSKIDQLKEMKCMALTKNGSKYAPGSEIFNIRGTRIFLIVKNIYNPFYVLAENDPAERLSFSWRYKKKNKNSFEFISFEDVLDSKLVSNEAKAEIIFNLNVFLN